MKNELNFFTGFSYTKNWFFSFCLLIFLFHTLLFYPEQMQASDLFFKKKLPNGLTVIIKEVKNSPVVSFNTWVRVGSIDEDDNQAGIAHCLENMLFKGSKTYGPGEMDRQIKIMGAKNGSFTSYDYTCFFVVGAKNYFDKIIELQADSLMNPMLDKEEFEKEKQVILDQMREYKSRPEEYLYNNLSMKTFAKHPYSRPIIGFEETVKKITVENLLAFHKSWYIPENVAIVVAGDVDSATVLKKISTIFSNWKGKSKKRKSKKKSVKKPVVNQKKEGYFSYYGDIKLCYANMAFRVSGINSEDLFSLDVLNKILSSGTSSRFYKALISQSLLANQVNTAFYPRKFQSLFQINFQTKPSKLSLAIKTLKLEIEKLKVEEVSDYELKRAKQIIVASEIYDNETPEQLALNLGELWAFDRLEIREDYLAHIDAVKKEDIKRVVKKYFGSRNRTIVSYLPNSLMKTMTRKILLPNDMSLVVKEHHGAPIVSVVLFIDAGGKYEPKNKTGLAYLLQKLIYKGTKKQTAEEISKKLEFLGTVRFSNATTSNLSMGFTCLAGNFEDSFEIFFNCLTQAVFPQEEFEKAKKLTIAEIKSRESELWNSSYNAVLAGLFPAHPLGRSNIGNEGTIQSLTRDDVVQYFEKYFHPSAFTLVIAGDIFYEDDIKKRIEATFGQLPKKEIFYPKISPPEPLTGPKELVIQRTKEQSVIIIANQAVPFKHKDLPALNIINAILSGSKYSRLTVNLRDQKSLALDTRSMVVASKDTGFFMAYITAPGSKRDLARKSLIEELEKLRKEFVTEVEIQTAKKFLIGSKVVKFGSLNSQAKNMALYEFMGLGYDYPDKYSGLLEKVTKDDLKRVILNYIFPKNHVIGASKTAVKTEK
ncbi:M16 family metallopeptidase [Candidatus Riflebacteria bacterium]